MIESTLAVWVVRKTYERYGLLRAALLGVGTYLGIKLVRRRLSSDDDDNDSSDT